MQQKWQETLVDHSQFPRRHGRLETATHEASGENPICGDRVRLYLEVDAEQRIRNARFEATGCAISLASASLLATHLVGLDCTQARELFRAVRGVLTGADWPPGLTIGELEALELVQRFPLRVKCASLSWHVLRQALEGGTNSVTTE
ncbi:MAG: SUF system NifU family Fe-S cluster assembly protein [Xanthomonadales bacterium]|nr:SUF system NifU family Fe-S cluster assembly protein [Xanthomonadales bacterium]